MQKVNGNYQFSASDIVNFLECVNLTHLDLKNLEQKLEKAADDEQAKLVQAKGIAHEKTFLAKLNQQHPGSIIDIVEKELNASKKRLKVLEEEKNNKISLVEINDYYGQQYAEHSELMKTIVIMLIPIPK